MLAHDFLIVRRILIFRVNKTGTKTGKTQIVKTIYNQVNSSENTAENNRSKKERKQINDPPKTSQQPK